MSVEDYFRRTLTFSELEPEDRLKVLYKFLEAVGPEGIRTRELLAKFPELPEWEIRNRINDLFFADIVETPYGRVIPTKKGLEILKRKKLTFEDFEVAPRVLKRLKRKPRKLRVFRVGMVWMFYAKEIKRYTPTPFAEFRAWVITRNTKKYTKSRFRKVLFNLVNLFPSVMDAWRRRQIYLGDDTGTAISARIVGLEIERIDRDEIREYFRTTGLAEPKFDEIYRYVAFFMKSRRLRVPQALLRIFLPIPEKRDLIGREYNERDIRRIEERRDRVKARVLEVLGREYIPTSRIAEAVGEDPRLVLSVLFELRRLGRVRLKRVLIRGKRALAWRR